MSLLCASTGLADVDNGRFCWESRWFVRGARNGEASPSKAIFDAVESNARHERGAWWIREDLTGLKRLIRNPFKMISHLEIGIDIMAMG